VENGANPAKYDRDGRTPLVVAKDAKEDRGKIEGNTENFDQMIEFIGNAEKKYEGTEEFVHNKRWFLRMISENLLNEAIDYL